MAILGNFLSNPIVQRGLSAAQALAGVPAAAPAPTQAETQRQQAEMERQRAFQAALIRPDMPIPPEFSTGSALVDEQERLRARYALMRDAGRSAVAERARAQGRSVTYDQAGNPVIGDMPQTPIVQAGPEGTRIAYRNGIPVGFSTPTATPPAQRPITPTAPMPAEMAQVRSRATGLAAERAAQVLRDAAIAAAAPVAATTAAAPAMAAPRAAVPAPRQTPDANELRLEEDLAALAEAERLAPAAAQSVTPQEEIDALNQAAAAAAEIERARPQKAAEKFISTTNDKIAALTQRLREATASGDVNEIRRLADEIKTLQARRTGVERGTALDMKPNQTARERRGY